VVGEEGRDEGQVFGELERLAFGEEQGKPSAATERQPSAGDAR
jgi:hypothetical protein